MVRNIEKYEQAIALRKRGFTLEEIAKYCVISKSTASKWLKNKAFSTHVTRQNKKRAGTENAKRLRLINKARVAERAKRYQEILKSADIEYRHYQNNPLFVAGVMVYLAEGDKKNQRIIRVANVRMDIHIIFIRFAIEYLGVEKSKIHFWLLLYPDHDEEKCMKKWHKTIELPYAQFYKNQVIQGKSSKSTLHYGAGNTIIGNTALKLKLNRWIELTVKQLGKQK
jgi:transcriptional regulator with XRE-family HTH domain